MPYLTIDGTSDLTSPADRQALATLQQRAQAARTANAAYLAIATPTAAQTSAQVQRLTKEVNALLTVFLAGFGDISDSA